MRDVGSVNASHLIRAAVGGVAFDASSASTGGFVALDLQFCAVRASLLLCRLATVLDDARSNLLGLGDLVGLIGLGHLWDFGRFRGLWRLWGLCLCGGLALFANFLLGSGLNESLLNPWVSLACHMQRSSIS